MNTASPEHPRPDLTTDFAMGRPCAECPWRLDVPPGKFPPERFEKLRESCEPGGLPVPMFPCHMTSEGKERACAGMLRVVGRDVNMVRIMLAGERIPGAAVYPQPDDPPLFDSYDAMAQANGCEP